MQTSLNLADIQFWYALSNDTLCNHSIVLTLGPLPSSIPKWLIFIRRRPNYHPRSPADPKTWKKDTGSSFGNSRTRSHGNANFRFLKSGGIVDSVTSHGGHVTIILEISHNTTFMRWFNTREQPKEGARKASWERKSKLREEKPVERGKAHLRVFRSSERVACDNKKYENNTWMCGNMKFISSVDQDLSRVSKANEWDILFNTRNKPNK